MSNSAHFRKQEILRALSEIAGDKSFTKAKESFKKGFAPNKEKLVSNTRKPSELKVSKSYQRAISSTAIKKYRQFNWQLATVIVVSVRPLALGGEIVVVDGQHTAMMGLLSEEDPSLDTLELLHDPDATLNEVQEAEAELFKKLNTDRKNPSKLDIIRNDIFLNDPDALRFESILKSCNLVIDGIGAEEGDEVTTQTGSRLIKTIQQYGEDYSSYIIKAVDTMRELWGVKDEENGEEIPLKDLRDDMIHGMTTLLVFLDFAGRVKRGSCQKLNGTGVEFKKWMKTEMGKVSMRKYHHNTAGGNTHFKIVHQIIKEYNYWAEQNGKTKISSQRLHDNGIINPVKMMTKEEARSLPKFPKDIQ